MFRAILVRAKPKSSKSIELRNCQLIPYHTNDRGISIFISRKHHLSLISTILMSDVYMKTNGISIRERSSKKPSKFVTVFEDRSYHEHYSNKACRKILLSKSSKQTTNRNRASGELLDLKGTANIPPNVGVFGSRFVPAGTSSV